MEIEFESLVNYKDTLKEVSVILEMAKSVISCNEKYAVLNKSAILLLTSKFENFIEASVEEFVYFINDIKLKNCNIPEWMKIGYSINLVGELMNVINKEDNTKKIKYLQDVSKIWDDRQVVSMKINNKFSYGKHGANELIKLFNNIGIKDIFKVVKINSLEENMLDEEVEHDFKGTFNNITNQRNFIIHQDRPPNITHKQVEEYRNYFEQFAEKLCEYLLTQLDVLKYHGNLVEEEIASSLDK